MDDLFKGSIASRLAEQVAQAGKLKARHGDTPLEAMGSEDQEDRVPESILPGQHLANVRLDRIAPAPEGQARQDFNPERLQALADSLKRSGVREPIIVTPHGAEPGRFQIVAGERRWRAAQLAGLIEIPCIVDPELVERKDKLLAQAEENLHRENLNPVEEAAVLAQIMNARGLGVREAGELLGKGYRQARRLQQLQTAAPPIKRAVARGQVDLRVAGELIRIFAKYARQDETPDSAIALRRIDALIERIVRGQWPLRKVEKYEARVGARARAEAEDDGETGKPGAVGTSPAGEGAPSTASPGPVRERPLWTREGGHLIIDAHRLTHGTVTPEERASLIAIIEGLLRKIRQPTLNL